MVAWKQWKGGTDEVNRAERKGTGRQVTSRGAEVWWGDCGGRGGRGTKKQAWQFQGLHCYASELNERLVSALIVAQVEVMVMVERLYHYRCCTYWSTFIYCYSVRTHTHARARAETTDTVSCIDMKKSLLCSFIFTLYKKKVLINDIKDWRAPWYLQQENRRIRAYLYFVRVLMCMQGVHLWGCLFVPVAKPAIWSKFTWIIINTIYNMRLTGWFNGMNWLQETNQYLADMTEYIGVF